MQLIKPGTILIADPFLKDPNFLRSVVLICDHKSEGSFGFVLNRKTEFELADLIKGIYKNDIPVYNGGPVETNTIHFIHQHPEEIEGATQIMDNVWWGGTFENVVDLVNANSLSKLNIKFFLGYSGWGEGQLGSEIKEKTWLLTKGTSDIFFRNETAKIWPAALQLLGGDYAQVANYPIDPQLN